MPTIASQLPDRRLVRCDENRRLSANPQMVNGFEQDMDTSAIEVGCFGEVQDNAGDVGQDQSRPPSNKRAVSQNFEALLQTGREALRRRTWREAFDLFSEADHLESLSPEDLERLAEAAWWVGRRDEYTDARQRAYAAHLESGNRPRAARMALLLAGDNPYITPPSVAAGWRSKAERLLADEPECVEHGYLARAHAAVAWQRGEIDAAYQHAERAAQVGRHFGDRDLENFGLHDKGILLTQRGQIADGMALVDEAMAAAVGGECGPWTTVWLYCDTLACCQMLADYRRAAEWTQVIEKCYQRQRVENFSGDCRVHRAGILRVRGAWAEAEREARRGCEEMRPYDLYHVAWALTEIGGIRLLTGDLAGAEEALLQAHELGLGQPGLALLRLAQGKVEAAAASIRRALDEGPQVPLVRVPLLPAQVEIALAAADIETARSAAVELEEIAKTIGTPALEASASCARGAVLLVEGNAVGARRSLRRGWQLWQEVGAPYEAAKARVLLADALRREGDAEGATLELRAAWAAFEHLGAVADARRAAEALGGEGASLGPSAVPTQHATKTFMFTDIVKSTNLIEAIGDDAWGDLLRWHDQILRTLFVGHDGEEVDHAGDGFFVAFETAASAIECAIAIQRTLAEHRRTHGFSPHVRVGLHTASSTRKGRGYRGKGIHEAARIAALAGPEEILASQETMMSVKHHQLSESRTVMLKGISKPVQVVPIAWR